MILYLDASALVKRFVAEPGTEAVNEIVSRAEALGTAIICRAEVAAAFAKAIRTGTLTPTGAAAALQEFRDQWPHLIRLQVTERLIAHADSLAWSHGLRGYDAVHLAAAMAWQDEFGMQVTLATFDQLLWKAANRTGILAYPPDLPALLEEWQRGRAASLRGVMQGR
jgi:predicted nucleic acid-binding protein